MEEEPDRVAMLSDLKRLEERLTASVAGMIAKDHEETRRHFNIMVEKVESAVKIVAEVNAHHAVVLDNHETRLKAIEE
jgi:hypothetical protein